MAGKGSTTSDKMWNLDGLAMTDMSATGASPDVLRLRGVQRDRGHHGRQRPAGAERRHQHQPDHQARHQPVPRRRAHAHGARRLLVRQRARRDGGTTRACQGNDKANHIKQISDYGFELGGPIIKDKLWFYGTYGKQDIRLITPDPDQGQDAAALLQREAELAGHLEHHGLGLLLPGQQAEVRARRRLPRARRPTTSSGTRTTPSPTAGCPGGLWKIQIDHTFSPNFFVSAKAAYYDTGFGLVPRGGDDRPTRSTTCDSEAIGSYQDYRPSARRRSSTWTAATSSRGWAATTS